MGNKWSRGRHDPCPQARAKFSGVENAILKSLHKDLVSRGRPDVDGIEKDTFLKCFPLPGLLGERLFAAFDRSNKGYVDYADFVEGMAVCCRGTLEQRHKLLFGMFDTHGTGVVSRKDLTTLLSHLPTDVLEVLHVGSPLPPGALTVPAVVSSLVSTIFHTTPSSDDGLDLSAFTHWLAGAPEVERLLASVFPADPFTSMHGMTTLDAPKDEFGSPPPCRRRRASAADASSLKCLPMLGTPRKLSGGSGSAIDDDAKWSSPPAGSPRGLHCSKCDAYTSQCPLCRTPFTDATVAEFVDGEWLVYCARCSMPTPPTAPPPAGSPLRAAEPAAALSRTVSLRAHVPMSPLVDAGTVLCSMSKPPPAMRPLVSSATMTPPSSSTSSSSSSSPDADDVVAGLLLPTPPQLSAALVADKPPLVVGGTEPASPMVPPVPLPPASSSSPIALPMHVPSDAVVSAYGRLRSASAGAPPAFASKPSRRDTSHANAFRRAACKCGAAHTRMDWIRLPDRETPPGLLPSPVLADLPPGGGGSFRGVLPGSPVLQAALGTSPEWALTLPSRALTRRRSWSLGAGSARSLYQQGLTVYEKEGWMHKVGRKVKVMKRRWYYLCHNMMYWYKRPKANAKPSGVAFIEGSYVSRHSDDSWRAKGFYGIDIRTSSAHGEKSRVIYLRSEAERAEWLNVLKPASCTAPFEEDYSLGEALGAGRFSKVRVATNVHTGEESAVKIINKADLKESERELLRTEIAVLKLVSHPHIVKLEAVYETAQLMYIVMERAPGGELFNRIVGRTRFTEPEARALMQPLIQAVYYLHCLGIVHRDIKPENILCGTEIADVKLADFGLSKLVKPDEVMKMACGTLSYVAPEVLTLKGYGMAADLWSVGVILYLIVRGRLPFEAPTREEVLAKTAAGRLDFTHSVWRSWSPNGLRFVRGLLEKDASKRLTAEAALNHPWFAASPVAGSQ